MPLTFAQGPVNRLISRLIFGFLLMFMQRWKSFTELYTLQMLGLLARWSQDQKSLTPYDTRLWLFAPEIAPNAKTMQSRVLNSKKAMQSCSIRIAEPANNSPPPLPHRPTFMGLVHSLRQSHFSAPFH